MKLLALSEGLPIVSNAPTEALLTPWQALSAIARSEAPTQFSGWPNQRFQMPSQLQPLFSLFFSLRPPEMDCTTKRAFAVKARTVLPLRPCLQRAGSVGLVNHSKISGQ